MYIAIVTAVMRTTSIKASGWSKGKLPRIKKAPIKGPPSRIAFIKNNPETFNRKSFILYKHCSTPDEAESEIKLLVNNLSKRQSFKSCASTVFNLNDKTATNKGYLFDGMYASEELLKQLKII